MIIYTLIGIVIGFSAATIFWCVKHHYDMKVTLRNVDEEWKSFAKSSYDRSAREIANLKHQLWATSTTDDYFTRF